MIQEKDVDTLIKAKKDQLAINILQVLSLLSLTILVILEDFYITHEYTTLLAVMSSVFMGAAMGQSKWVAVSRSKLIQTLESIINNDAEGLKILAEKRGSGSSSTTSHNNSL